MPRSRARVGVAQTHRFPEYLQAPRQRFARRGPTGADAWHTVVTSPREIICLQAADSFLWSLQRFYEPRVHPETGEVTHEARYLNAIWPQVSQIHDLHFVPAHGTFFTPANPMKLEARFGPRPLKTKKPHV